MNIIKPYLKIMKQNFPNLLIYISIFALFLVLNQLAIGGGEDILSAHDRVGIVDFTDGKESKGLIEFLKEKNDVYLVDYDEIKIKDEIISGYRDFYLIIREDGMEYFHKKDQINSYLVKSEIETYLNTMDNFSKYLDKSEIEEVILENVDYEFALKKSKDTKEQFLENMYRMVPYSIMGLIFNVIFIGTKNFVKEDMINRIETSGISKKDFYLKLFVSALLVLFVIWILVNLVIGVSFEALATRKWALYSINLLVFMLPIIAIGEFICLMVKRDAAIQGVIQLITLGTSFISGVFVPQSMLSDNILRAASFFPPYWLLEANKVVLRGGELVELALPYGIMSLQCIAIIALAIIVSGKKINFVK